MNLICFGLFLSYLQLNSIYCLNDYLRIDFHFCFRERERLSIRLWTYLFSLFVEIAMRFLFLLLHFLLLHFLRCISLTLMRCIFLLLICFLVRKSFSIYLSFISCRDCYEKDYLVYFQSVDLLGLSIDLPSLPMLHSNKLFSFLLKLIHWKNFN